jgi:hypothetical protein
MGYIHIITNITSQNECFKSWTAHQALIFPVVASHVGHSIISLISPGDVYSIYLKYGDGSKPMKSSTFSEMNIRLHPFTSYFGVHWVPGFWPIASWNHPWAFHILMVWIANPRVSLVKGGEPMIQLPGRELPNDFSDRFNNKSEDLSDLSLKVVIEVS